MVNVATGLLFLIHLANRRFTVETVQHPFLVCESNLMDYLVVFACLLCRSPGQSLLVGCILQEVSLLTYCSETRNSVVGDQFLRWLIRL